MARVLRSTKITIAEDPSTSTENTPQPAEPRRTESRAALSPIDNVTETVVVSVDEAHEADEEKLLKAAFKSAIGVKKKKKAKRERKTKQDSSEQVSGDNDTPDENAANPAEVDDTKPAETDNDKLQHLLKDLQDTHITAPAAVPEPAHDITLIRNVPTGPARRTRSQHNGVRHAQPGQYIPPSNYLYPHGGRPGPPPPWVRVPGYGHYRPPVPIPYPPHHNSRFGGFRPGVFAGPPPPVLRGGYMGYEDSCSWQRQQQIEERNSLEQVQRWLAESTPRVSLSLGAGPVANHDWRKVEQEQQKQEPIYVYTGATRYVSNSTIEISARGDEETNEESMDDAPADRPETEAEAEAEGETEIEAQVEAQFQQNEEAVEAEAPPAYNESEHDIEETEKASAAEVKAPTPTASETELAKDKPDTYSDEPSYDEDSFIHHIVERTPAKPARRRSSLDEQLKLTRFASRPGSAADLVDNLEKFEDIITRSPAKPVSRIEDSLEKLDMDEDLMEALVEVVSGSARGSPAKGNSPVPAASVVKKKAPVTPAATKGTVRRAATVTGRPAPASATVGQRGGRALVSRMTTDKAAAGTATVRAKAPVPRQSQSAMAAAAAHRRSASVASGSVQSKDSPFSTSRPPAKRPISLLPPKVTVKATRAPIRPSFELPGEKVARALKEKREAREARMAQRDAYVEKTGTVKRPISTIAPTVRSSKPPTKPSFELPGETLSRKKREEHQAKVKAMEEEEKKRREFKAKPVRRSIGSTAPSPRETAASLARKSIAGHPASDLGVGKRSLRPSIAETDHDNVVHSAPRTRVGSKTFERKTLVSTKPTGPSMSGLAMQRTPSISASAPKKLSGKEIYKRDARVLENAEEERRAKQEAAMKAREEAAERGRQASREWAEKQKRKMLEVKTVEPGLSAGYGPRAAGAS